MVRVVRVRDSIMQHTWSAARVAMRRHIRPIGELAIDADAMHVLAPGGRQHGDEGQDPKGRSTAGSKTGMEGRGIHDSDGTRPGIQVNLN